MSSIVEQDSEREITDSDDLITMGIFILGIWNLQSQNFSGSREGIRKRLIRPDTVFAAV